MSYTETPNFRPALLSLLSMFLGPALFAFNPDAGMTWQIWGFVALFFIGLVAQYGTLVGQLRRMGKLDKDTPDA